MSQERHIDNTDEQAVAQFSGAEITAIRSGEDQLIYASLAQLCQAIGLDTESQRERIAEHAVLFARAKRGSTIWQSRCLFVSRPDCNRVDYSVAGSRPPWPPLSV